MLPETKGGAGTASEAFASMPTRRPSRLHRLGRLPWSVSAPLLGNLFDELAGLGVVGATRDVRLGDYADEPAVVLDHRQATNLTLRHQPERLVEILLRIHGHEVGRSDLRHPGRLRI